ncbi:hypothetical protein MCEMSEM29_01285 [Methylophilaceae bacterium]
MLEKLPGNLDEALRIIANEEQIAMPLDDIRKLLLMSLITHKLGGGWMVNSKGREYLKRHKR